MALVNLFNESSLYSNRPTRRHLSRGRKHPQDKYFESRHLSDPSQASALCEPLEPRLLLSADMLWVQQFGSSKTEEAYGVAVDGSGNAYVTGRTAGGDLEGTNAGGSDAFLAKFGESQSCTTINDLRGQVQSLNTKASVKRSLGKLLSSVEKQLDKGKNPTSMSKLIVKLVGYSSDPDHKKYVPVDEANTLILASANYLSCLNGQPCTFTSTNFDDLRGVIDNLSTSNKAKKKMNNMLSRVELDGPTVQLAERVGLTKFISTLMNKSSKLGLSSNEANDLICQVAHVMTRG